MTAIAFEPNENYRPVEHTTGHEGIAPPTNLGGMESLDNPGGDVQAVRGPDLVDQQPVDVVPQPDICGTFAMYILPDGSAGLILDIMGRDEPVRQRLPQMVVEMVLHGKRPTLKDVTRFMTGGGK